MSHNAVNWALEQQSLKPAPWVVLIKVADRHNKDSRLAYPSQDLLASDCNMSRATVNRHLESLESEGLLRRVQRIHPKTKKQLTTYYILALDFENPPIVEHAVSQNETRNLEVKSANSSATRVSKCDTDPCLKNDESRVSKNAIPVSQNETLTLVKEPVIEPCAVSAHKSDFDFDKMFQHFWKEFPRKTNERSVRAQFRKSVEESELAPEAISRWIIRSAAAYAVDQKGNKPQYVKTPEPWLQDRRWRDYPDPGTTPRPKPSQGEIEAAAVSDIKSGKLWLCARIDRGLAISLAKAGRVTGSELREANLATVDDLREAGVSL